MRLSAGKERGKILRYPDTISSDNFTERNEASFSFAQAVCGYIKFLRRRPGKGLPDTKGIQSGSPPCAKMRHQHVSLLAKEGHEASIFSPSLRRRGPGGG